MQGRRCYLINVKIEKGLCRLVDIQIIFLGLFQSRMTVKSCGLRVKILRVRFNMVEWWQLAFSLAAHYESSELELMRA